jgi:hypothetical protein
VEVTASLADDWLRLNRAWWDERAPVHAASGFYDVPGFLAGRDSLRAFEPGEVGDVRGNRLLHLMCHIGLDTLSWARTVAALVAPGGFFYIADYHPFPDSFDIVDGEVRRLRHGYLDHGPWVEQAAGSYTGSAQTSANTFIKWNHHIGSVVNALAAAGLRIEFLHEYDFTDAPFHGLERGEDGLWRIPADQFQIPLMFSLRAAQDP